jgi:hypothetical protein
MSNLSVQEAIAKARQDASDLQGQIKKNREGTNDEDCKPMTI